MISEFKADCTVNLWIEASGHPTKFAWACAIEVDEKRILTLRKFLGMISVDEAETSALLVGLRRARRLLQEKVEVRANFPLEGRFDGKKNSGRRRGPDLQSEWEEISALWTGTRLIRAGKLDPRHAKILADEARKMFRRRDEKRGKS